MIYIVCSCDIWKMRNSMRIITATTSIAKLKQLIAQLIEDGTFGYGVAQNPDGNDAASRFREDYNVHDTITIDGIEFEIVGIGHDIDALTGRNNTITLRQVDHLKKSRINPGPCPDGYAASESESEMFGSAIYSPAEDGRRYEAFATNKDRVADDEDGSACCVWLRSALVGGSRVFCMVNTSGSASIDIADYSRGVALGFCI